MTADPKWKRANYVASPQFYMLNQACLVVAKAFDTCPYLVGSSIVRRDYRDVDVRLIMEDAKYDRMFGGPDQGYLNAYWSLLCTSISLYLSKASDLPIDFQIQRQTQANERHDGTRHALGIFLDYPGETPTLYEKGT
jgi:hypothetical protein